MYTKKRIPEPDYNDFSTELNNAIKGLSVLGYGSDEINQALRGQDLTDKSAEDIIKLVLKQMVK